MFEHSDTALLSLVLQEACVPRIISLENHFFGESFHRANLRFCGYTFTCHRQQKTN